MNEKRLAILTRPDDSFVEQLLQEQRALCGTTFQVADLTAGEPDYDLLLDQIFAADTVQVF